MGSGEELVPENFCFVLCGKSAKIPFSKPNKSSFGDKSVEPVANEPRNDLAHEAKNSPARAHGLQCFKDGRGFFEGLSSRKNHNGVELLPLFLREHFLGGFALKGGEAKSS